MFSKYSTQEEVLTTKFLFFLKSNIILHSKLTGSFIHSGA